MAIPLSRFWFGKKLLQLSENAILHISGGWKGHLLRDFKGWILHKAGRPWRAALSRSQWKLWTVMHCDDITQSKYSSVVFYNNQSTRGKRDIVKTFNLRANVNVITDHPVAVLSSRPHRRTRQHKHGLTWKRDVVSLAWRLNLVAGSKKGTQRIFTAD